MRMVLLVLCKKDLFGIGVWRDGLIIADPFMKLASWQTRVSPALLTNVSNMFIIIIIVRGTVSSPPMKGQRTPPRSTPKRTCVAGVAVRAVAGRAFVVVPLIDADDAVVVGAVVTGGAVVVVVCFSRWTIYYDSLHVCTC